MESFALHEKRSDGTMVDTEELHRQIFVLGKALQQKEKTEKALLHYPNITDAVKVLHDLGVDNLINNGYDIF